MDILLVRHGQSEGNRDERLQGSCDMPLTERGRTQARRLGAWLQQRNIGCDASYCSPLSRAKETAAIVTRLAELPAPEVLESTAEIHAGTLENMTREEIVAAHPGFTDRRLSSLGDFSDYGGESYGDVMARVEQTVELLFARHRASAHHVLIVAHGGFNYHFTKRLLCEPVPRLCMLRWGNCTATLLRMRERRGHYIGELSWHVTNELMDVP
jgi:broad specificity phosphatase PhoE